MTIPEPDGPLWTAVKPMCGWPQTDEAAMRELARSWRDAGMTFLAEGSQTAGDRSMVSQWPDQAGTAFRARLSTMRSATVQGGKAMKQLGAHVSAFADDVTYAKQEIVRVIEENEKTFTKLRGMLGGVDAAAREQFAAELGRSIKAFLDAMTARVSGREIDTPLSDLPRPNLRGPEEPLGDKLENGALWATEKIAGSVSRTPTPAFAAGQIIKVAAHGARRINETHLFEGDNWQKGEKWKELVTGTEQHPEVNSSENIEHSAEQAQDADPAAGAASMSGEAADRAPGQPSPYMTPEANSLVTDVDRLDAPG